MLRLLIHIFVVTIFKVDVNPARILGVYPIPSFSHQVVFRALTLELVKRGHEVVVITTDPAFKNKEPPANLTEVDISDSYKLIMKMFNNSEVSPRHANRGVIIEPDAILSNEKPIKPMNELMYSMYDISEVKKLIADKKQKFDLVIMEGLGYSQLIFSEIFKAPAILFSSMYGTTTNYETIGAVARHPQKYPNFFRSQFRNLSILESIKEIYMEYKFWKYDRENEISDNNFLKSRFGSNAPTVGELKKNVVLLFVNSHPIFDGNRPVPPGAVYLGAVHLQTTKELPQDLKSYLDNSTRGVVYVSLGTNVRYSFMEKDFLEAFVEAFEIIPYDILWKFDGDQLETVPTNVKIQKWFPQRDLLDHPNIKLFVMQGGLQSTDEAIDAAVPIVGIPMLADQWFNTNKYVEFGIGVQLDSYTMRAEDLVKAVNTVANNPSYKENIIKLRAIIRDQPQKPIDRAVWWVEHVLRHKGSRHLLGATAQMSWSQYLMLDVVAALAIAFTILATVALVATYYIVRLVLRAKSFVKVKQN